MNAGVWGWVMLSTKPEAWLLTYFAVFDIVSLFKICFWRSAGDPFKNCTEITRFLKAELLRQIPNSHSGLQQRDRFPNFQKVKVLHHSNVRITFKSPLEVASTHVCKLCKLRKGELLIQMVIECIDDQGVVLGRLRFVFYIQSGAAFKTWSKNCSKRLTKSWNSALFPCFTATVQISWNSKTRWLICMSSCSWAICFSSTLKMNSFGRKGKAVLNDIMIRCGLVLFADHSRWNSWFVKNDLIFM